MRDYFRPLAQMGHRRPSHQALTLAGGWCWFDRIEVVRRSGLSDWISPDALPDDVRDALCAPRAPVARVPMDRPTLMGIVNTTPDSFSDGGQFDAPDRAVAHAKAMIAAGADMIDIGGESTRPGAADVDIATEIARTTPVITALRADHPVPVSIDTRKAAVAQAALGAGADLINDVAAMTYDPALGQIAAKAEAPLCLMHAQGAPETMQDAPRYDDVLLDVYDFLAERVAAAVKMGVPRHRIMVDPGIGFGKTLAHNLALLRGLSLFHGLGCPILLGASRKRFIGTLAQVDGAADRMPGSVAVALAGVAQGAQMIRVHDLAETRQALTLFCAVTGESNP